VTGRLQTEKIKMLKVREKKMKSLKMNPRQAAPVKREKNSVGKVQSWDGIVPSNNSYDYSASFAGDDAE